MIYNVQEKQVELKEEDIYKQIEDLKVKHPDIAEAMRVLDISEKVYMETYKPLIEPQITTTDTLIYTGQDIY